MHKIRSWRAASIVVLGIFVSLVGAASLAEHTPGHDVLRGRGVKKTVVVTSTDDWTIFVDEWKNIRGAKTQITVPAGQRALLLMRFTAETVCYSGGPDFCSARILVDNREALPAAGRNFHIDSNYSGETFESQKGHAMDRSLEVGPGTYTVRVQGTAMEGLILTVDDWSLTVQSVRA